MCLENLDAYDAVPWSHNFYGGEEKQRRNTASYDWLLSAGGAVPDDALSTHLSLTWLVYCVRQMTRARGRIGVWLWRMSWETGQERRAWTFQLEYGGGVGRGTQRKEDARMPGSQRRTDIAPVR